MADNYESFIRRIKMKLGIDLSLYKETQMKRRILSLRNKKGYDSFITYFRALEQDKELMLEFTNRLTINVSEFYRNPQRWEVLQEKIIPELLKVRTRINIWSAACSTGEEPYSLAMMFKENFPTANIKIIATDIDDAILQRAKAGIYQRQAFKDLPLAFQKKYFTVENELYYIEPSLKRNITFKKHNLLAEPYPKNIDLIVCRNVLIYFTDEAKIKIYNRFSESLVDKGILFVGSTEQIFTPEQYKLTLFDTFFYQKNT